jgi:hypothetical protein
MKNTMTQQEKLNRVEQLDASTVYRMFINTPEKNEMFYEYFTLLEMYTEGDTYETPVQDLKTKTVVKFMIKNNKI